MSVKRKELAWPATQSCWEHYEERAMSATQRFMGSRPSQATGS